MCNCYSGHFSIWSIPYSIATLIEYGVRRLIKLHPAGPPAQVVRLTHANTLPVIFEDEGNDMAKSQDAKVNSMVSAARGLLKADTTLHPKSRAVLLHMKALAGNFDETQCAQAQALLLQEFPKR